MRLVLKPVQQSYVQYLVAMGACALAVLLQLLIWPYIPPSPQLFFYPAVLVAAWFGGLAPGVVAVLLIAASLTGAIPATNPSCP